MDIPPRTRAWIEVAAPALRRNYRRVAQAVGPDPWIVPMVKADGYGLGARQVVEALAPEGPSAWGVATVAEGAALRDAGVDGPIIVFAPIPPQGVEAAVALDLAVAVSDPGLLARLAAEGRRRERPARVHLEVDTGMGRAGLPAASVARWAPAVSALRDGPAGGLRWEGLFTHLHSADEAGGPGVRDQLRAFRTVASTLAPPASVRLHVANSAGAFRLGAEAGGARPGIFLYGGGIGPDLPAPEPVASVRARIVRVADVPAGATVGYGATYRAECPERWATLAVGYGDGLPRCLGNRGHALVSGRRVPLVGRISMDVAVANISGLPGVEAGNVATLVGRDGTEEILLDDVAALADTISYEILTGWTPRLPRTWTEAE